MKRMIALLAALVLFALPCVAEPATPFDYTDDILEDGSPIYYFQDLSLTLPAEWAGKVMAMQEGEGAAFYQTASYEKYAAEGLEGGGFLFQLAACADESYKNLPAYEPVGWCERSGMNYYLILPSDYPAYMGDEDVRAEYDALSAQIGFVAEHAQFYEGTGEVEPAVEEAEAPAAAEEAEAEEAAEAPAAAGEAAEVPAARWTAAQVRYQFEHRMLPRYFHDDPENMLGVLRDVGLYRLWASVTIENGVDPTYPEADYVLHFFTAADGAKLLQIELPQPDANLLCYRIYMVYSPATGESGYYTVESDDFDPSLAFVCAWTKDGTHMNYGGKKAVDRSAADYAEALAVEAVDIAKLAGISEELTPDA